MPSIRDLFWQFYCYINLRYFGGKHAWSRGRDGFRKCKCGAVQPYTPRKGKLQVVK